MPPRRDGQSQHPNPNPAATDPVIVLATVLLTAGTFLTLVFLFAPN